MASPAGSGSCLKHQGQLVGGPRPWVDGFEGGENTVPELRVFIRKSTPGETGCGLLPIFERQEALPPVASNCWACRVDLALSSRGLGWLPAASAPGSPAGSQSRQAFSLPLWELSPDPAAGLRLIGDGQQAWGICCGEGLPPCFGWAMACKVPQRPMGPPWLAPSYPDGLGTPVSSRLISCP